ncbi:MAG: hypothetical protein AB1656_16600 [Candidatus Omnitrophota bacterium]
MTGIEAFGQAAEGWGRFLWTHTADTAWMFLLVGFEEGARSASADYIVAYLKQ